MSNESPITLELHAEQAINLLLLLNRECELYSQDTAPLRIEQLRDTVNQLDALLDIHFDTKR